VTVSGFDPDHRASGALWTDDGELGDLEDPAVPGRSLAYARLPFDELMLVNEDGVDVVMGVQGHTLDEVIKSTVSIPGNAGRAAWLALAGPTADLQPSCREGINLHASVALRGRIGTVGNNETDCQTPDSAVGVGLDYGACGISGGNVNRLGSNTCDPLTIQVYGRQLKNLQAVPAPTCRAHLENGGRSSGLYRLGDGERVFCEQERDGGGWQQVFAFDALGPEPCPAGLEATTLTADGPRLGCELLDQRLSASIDVTAPFPWSALRVTVLALQVGTTDAFGSPSSGPAGLNGGYVDGFSLTRGGGQSRTHLFTWAVGNRENGLEQGNCPCRGGEDPPSFVGDDYRCEAGARDAPGETEIVIVDPVFDGFEIGGSDACRSEGSGAPAVIAVGQATGDVVTFRALRTGFDENVSLVRLIIEARE
jgi:hypothetical protein